ncbi:MAG: DNA-directed RNA polymerase subunit omega [Lachnospiraceae bacterium]|nr:DNA-directed RNA polymerase subunit omega [Lachnospiraceae bacterium]
MLHPSYTDLMEVVNSDVEPGEQPVVQSRYSIVMAASKRARQIITERGVVKENKDPQKDIRYNEHIVIKCLPKPLSVAVGELYSGKVKILGDEEE